MERLKKFTTPTRAYSPASAIQYGLAIEPGSKIARPRNMSIQMREKCRERVAKLKALFSYDISRNEFTQRVTCVANSSGTTDALLGMYLFGCDIKKLAEIFCTTVEDVLLQLRLFLAAFKAMLKALRLVGMRESYYAVTTHPMKNYFDNDRVGVDMVDICLSPSY